MGKYINPPSMEKEEFLALHGQRISTEEVLNFNFDGSKLPVCLVDNGWMTAAGIADTEHERDAFADPNDHRPKKWYSVSVELLKPYL